MKELLNYQTKSNQISLKQKKMPGKIEQHITALNSSADWIAYLRSNSGLPGPRGNLELAQAVSFSATREQLDTLLAIDKTHPQENTPDTFVVFCGVRGQGKFARQDAAVRKLLRCYATDTRWRIREAVAMALQDWGKHDMDSLLMELESWPLENPLEMRAIAAAICEPGLLIVQTHADRVLGLLDRITATILLVANRKADDFRVLRQGLAYCWSVAVAAYPQPGKQYMERWLHHPDSDIHWLMYENLKKNRLIKMDPDWVARFL
jgi:hypothetical protein